MRCTLLLVAVLAACGNQAAPASPPAASSAAPETAASVAPAEPTPAPASKRKPFELVNSCADVVTVVFGEDPKGKGRTLAPLSTVEIPRNPEGHDVVWLLTKGEPVKVFVTRGMKKVEVGRSCSTLDAR